MQYSFEDNIAFNIPSKGFFQYSGVGNPLWDCRDLVLAEWFGTWTHHESGHPFYISCYMARGANDNVCLAS